MATVDIQLNQIDEEYRLLVEEAAEKNQNFDIPNSTLEHALFLTQKLMSKSQNDVKILTGELSSPYYDRLKEDIEVLAKRMQLSKGKIKIIVWDGDAVKNEAFEGLIKKYEDVIELRLAAQTNPIPHFLVSDAIRYRIEDLHTKEQVLKKEIRGRANFCNPEIAKILDNTFNRVWDQVPH